jgi:hypothetical protein
MVKKILFFTLMLFSVFALSACEVSDEVKNQFSEKITGVSQKYEETKTETKLDTFSDEQLLEELENDPGIDIDADFSSLEKELEQL